ncbi:Nicotinamide mononucleotide transporter [Malonomonas rubra DSM 5091]|uniref:Nicotinamide mononucleotide transporter n=1 Tax=Malonomonas rubra DSM 5091 TaxID=1122189 RepID=A0A1M6HC36_MALRU|nr:nicotinamide mononucleotide transporter [Malonomonas rubra]SHJ19765.1 Nicotinamide mononucleotide transporter [Malonomonas rubra DSM 5091]
MDLILQAWGGGFYLLNKIFFAFAEGSNEQNKRKLRIAGWAVYLLGLPAWVIILIGKHDWMAAAIEAGGAPAMLFGLINAYRGELAPSRRFDRIISFFTYSFLALGISYSLYDYGGLTSLSQLLEIGVVIGFLVGSYLLAKKNSKGWLFFMLMNISTGSLMLLQDKYLLAGQQLVSLCFVMYGFSVVLRSRRADSSKN